MDVNLERLCPYCHENLSLNKDEAQNGRVVQCPVCKKNVKVKLKGLFSKRAVLVKTSIF